jgi:hypothetical protein
MNGVNVGPTDLIKNGTSIVIELGHLINPVSLQESDSF